MTPAQAEIVDAYSLKKDGGVFVREAAVQKFIGEAGPVSARLKNAAATPATAEISPSSQLSMAPRKKTLVELNLLALALALGLARREAGYKDQFRPKK